MAPWMASATVNDNDMENGMHDCLDALDGLMFLYCWMSESEE